MKKNQVADLSALQKNTDKSPSANTKKKDDKQKQNKNSPNFTEMTNQQQSTSQKSDQDNLISGSPSSRPKMQKLQSQETSNNTNLPPQPPKQKKKIKSILASEDQNKKTAKTTQPVEERKDYFGQPITKGPNKNFKICFSPQIEEVYEVENWKEYNKEEKYGLCSCCRCNVF